MPEYLVKHLEECYEALGPDSILTHEELLRKDGYRQAVEDAKDWYAGYLSNPL